MRDIAQLMNIWGNADQVWGLLGGTHRALWVVPVAAGQGPDIVP